MLHDERFCISTVHIIHMSFSASNNVIIVVTVVVPRVCVCVPVRIFWPPRASRPRCTCSPRHRKLLYNNFYKLIFAKNASFKSYGVICLLRCTNYSGATKYGYQRNPRNVGIILLFAVLIKNDSFRSYSTFVYLLRAHILYLYAHN